MECLLIAFTPFSRRSVQQRKPLHRSNVTITLKQCLSSLAAICLDGSRGIEDLGQVNIWYLFPTLTTGNSQAIITLCDIYVLA
jgi:hypothetical protein